MTFMESVKTCFSKYFSYQGRAKRSEYWYFFLFCFLIAIAAIIFENIFLANYDSIYFSPISSFAELILSKRYSGNSLIMLLNLSSIVLYYPIVLHSHEKKNL